MKIIERKFVYINSVDGTLIFYETIGIGPAIILIHGLGGDHKIWSETGWIDELKNYFKVISMDLRGCGQSGIPHDKDSYSIEKHIADISTIIIQEDINNPILFGWSLGGTITTQFAVKNTIKKAVICGTHFGLIFSKEFIDKGIKGTDDIILQNRMRAFSEWPIIQPVQMKCPYLIYTGTKDGNVVKQLNIQREKIINNNGNLVIFDELDHMGLLNKKEIVKETVLRFINE